MTALEQAIRDAVEKGGWDWRAEFNVPSTLHFHPSEMSVLTKIEVWHTLMTPAFWQALGKARGWGRFVKIHEGGGFHPDEDNCPSQWRDHEDIWIGLIRHLASGKDIESFFATV